MKDNSSFLDIRRLEPQRDAERLVSSEVSLLGLDWFIAIELNSLSKLARNQTIVPFQFCRSVCFGVIGQVAIFYSIETQRHDRLADHRQLLGMLFNPCHGLGIKFLSSSSNFLFDSIDDFLLFCDLVICRIVGKTECGRRW